MKDSPETFGISSTITDPIYMRQQQDVASMRQLLLNCNINDPNSVRSSMQNILVMRIYHQISRIIKFTEQMDKIEAKLYDSIDKSLDTMNDTDPRTWMSLLNIQERLQKTMIDSQKLLDPYLSIKELTYIDVPEVTAEDSFAKSLLDQQSREKLRTSAQAILAALDTTSETSETLETEDGEGED